jgi:serine/threonine-protein kinase HipA
VSAAMAKSKRRRASRPTGVVAQARVHLWERFVGVVTEYDNGRIGFSYDRDYAEHGVAISPRWLPLRYPHTFEFGALRRSEAFLGLPGVLADSLPDRFGNLVIRSYF